MMPKDVVNNKNALSNNSRQNIDVIEILDPNLKQGFAQLPRPVLKARGLSRNAKCLYALLLDYAWQEGSCFPGQQRLAEDMDVTDRTIRTDLKELREYGLIDWKQRGLMLSNIYYIMPLATNPRLGLTPESSDRKNSSGQDRKYTSASERKPTSDKKYSVEEYSITTNDDDMAVLLQKFGISKSQARRLTTNHPADVILQKLDLVQYLQSANSPLVVRNPQGWLVRAIDENYLPTKPKGYRSKADREEDENERRRHEEEIRLAQEARTKAIADFIQNRPTKRIPDTKLTTKTAWTQALEYLQKDISSANFNMWLRNTLMVDYQKDQALIGVPTAYVAEWLQDRMRSRVVNALSNVIGRRVEVEFEAVPEMTKGNTDE